MLSRCLNYVFFLSQTDSYQSFTCNRVVTHLQKSPLSASTTRLLSEFWHWQTLRREYESDNHFNLPLACTVSSRYYIVQAELTAGGRSR